MPAGVPAERQRHDHLAAEFVALGLIDPDRRGLERGKVGPEQQCQRGEREQRERAAEPAHAADVLRQVGHQVEPADRERDALAPLVEMLAQRGEAADDRARVGEHLGLRQLRGGYARTCMAEQVCVLVTRVEQSGPPSSRQPVHNKNRGKAAPAHGPDAKPCLLKVNVALISAG